MTWQEEFRSAIEAVVLSKGHPARPRETDDWRDPWTYGTIRQDWHDIMDHQKTCAFHATGKVEPVRWSEFQDTFSDNKDAHGLICVASCECGVWYHVLFLYEGTLGQVMEDLLKEVVK